MAEQKISPASGIAPPRPELGADEKAVLESVRTGVLRNMLAKLWQVKLHLQFTGWLQYLPPALLALVFLLAAGFTGLFRQAGIAVAFLSVGCLLLASSIFELLTVKYRLRWPEPLPARQDELGLFDLMRARRSCRSFQTRKMTASDRNELLQSVSLHSGMPGIGNQPVRFEYISAPLTVWPTVNASEFLVAITPRQYDRLAVIDVGRKLQKIVIDATRMGLGTCWIGPGADHASIIRHLGERFNPQKDRIICVCALGYCSRYIPLFLRVFNWQFRRRLPISALFYADPQFEVPLDIQARPFNLFGRNFEICQWAPSSYNGQTTRCVAVAAAEGQEKKKVGLTSPNLVRFDFYAATESRFYAPVAVGIWCANWELGCQNLGIRGHFEVLPAKERKGEDGKPLPLLPRYDVSWVLEEQLK